MTVRIIAGWLFLSLVLACDAATVAPTASNLPTSTVGTSQFSGVSGFTITGSATGTASNLTVAGSIQVSPADAGKNGVIYVMARIANSWFFKGAGGAWTLWNSGAFPAPYFQGVLGTHSVSVVANMDLSLFPGTEFYAGYGLNQDDMVANGKYQKLAASPPPSTQQFTAIGTYTYSAGTGTVNWTSSDFPSDCDGPTAGTTDAFAITSITATTMVITAIDNTKTRTWTRSGGIAGDITGTWRATDSATGNSWEFIVNANGTVSIIGYMLQCNGSGNSTEEYSVWTGLSRKMTASGASTDMVLHIHAWAPQGTITQVALSGPSLNRTFTAHQTNVRNGVTVDEFVSDNPITITPRVGDTYTFTVTRTDSTTFTRTQSLSRVLLDAPLITSPMGHAIADASLGQTLNLTWTIPSGVVKENIFIGGQVCNPSGCANVNGTATSATTGTIDLPALTDPASAFIDVRVHYGSDVFMNCGYEFR